MSIINKILSFFLKSKCTKPEINPDLKVNTYGQLILLGVTGRWIIGGLAESNNYIHFVIVRNSFKES